MQCMHIYEIASTIINRYKAFLLISAMTDIASSLDAKIALYRFGSHANAISVGLKDKDLTSILANVAATPPVVQEKGNFNDKLLYIYTSGTTGLPKAAIITSSRYIYTYIYIQVYFT